MAIDEGGGASALLYRVISVWQSTQFVRRRGRKIQIDLTLVSGHDLVAVRVDDVQYTGSTKAAPRWQVGDSLSIPDPKGLKRIVLSPDALKLSPWSAARHRPAYRRFICL
ncbi:MAG: hypothetical protein IH945_06415 [Armatimonadetes bacterium]|nr:hypothetical protein [Armatimonadota bacterium]